MNQNNFDPMTLNMKLNMINVMYPSMGYNTNNYNFNMNNAYLMNIMNNWMKMNPNLLLMYQNMAIQSNKLNNNYNNIINQFNNNINKMKLVNDTREDLNQAKITGGGIIPKNMLNNSSYNLMEQK